MIQTTVIGDVSAQEGRLCCFPSWRHESRRPHSFPDRRDDVLGDIVHLECPQSLEGPWHGAEGNNLLAFRPNFKETLARLFGIDHDNDSFGLEETLELDGRPLEYASRGATLDLHKRCALGCRLGLCLEGFLLRRRRLTLGGTLAFGGNHVVRGCSSTLNTNRAAFV